MANKSNKCGVMTSYRLIEALSRTKTSSTCENLIVKENRLYQLFDSKGLFFKKLLIDMTKEMHIISDCVLKNQFTFCIIEGESMKMS